MAPNMSANTARRFAARWCAALTLLGACRTAAPLASEGPKAPVVAHGGGPAQAEGSGAGLAGADGRKALLVTRPSVQKGDDALRGRLAALGYEVTSVKDTDPAAPGTFALIVISEAAESADVGTKYTNNPAPIVTSEQGALPRLGMAAAGKKVKGRTAIQIGENAHPIAAGLKGTVEVYTKASILTHGVTPAPSVTAVATLDPSAPDSANAFTLLAVEKGAALAGGLVAPARRAYWFLEDEYTADLTPDGWKIFDACVAWAVGRQ